MGLDRQCADQSQTAFRIGEDAHHMGAPLKFLIEALKHVGRLNVLVVGERQPVISES